MKTAAVILSLAASALSAPPAVPVPAAESHPLAQAPVPQVSTVTISSSVSQAISTSHPVLSSVSTPGNSLPQTVVVSSTSIAGPAATAAPAATLATVYTKCTVNNTVALTFDDGPYIYAYDVSKALIAAGAKGTFFFNGNNYGCIYDADEQKRVKYVFDKGHQVASHTWSHSDLTTLSFDKLHDEMWKVEQALERIVGVAPAFMRPPYGNYNDLVRQVSAQRNQSLAIWDFDSGDSIGESPSDSEADYVALIKKHPATILALNHEPIETTAHQVLPYVLDKLNAAGYKMVTLAECLGKQPYQWTTTPGTPDSSWHC